MIEVKQRRGGANHLILRDGVVVGEVWKLLKESGFGVSLYGWCWRNGELSHGGCACTGARRLQDVAELVQGALDRKPGDLKAYGRYAYLWDSK